MTFDKTHKEYINEYITSHIESKEYLRKKDIFAFIKNEKERDAILNQFYSTRTVYKFFEGMHAENEILDAEAKIQVILYLSFIEYSCDYLIKNQLHETNTVKNSLKSSGLKKLKITYSLLEKVAKSVNRDVDDIVLSTTDTKKDNTSKLQKITFNDKLRIVEESLNEMDEKARKRNRDSRYAHRHPVFEEIGKLVYLRNNIHLSHEFKDGRASELSDSRSAYKLVKKFSNMMNEF